MKKNQYILFLFFCLLSISTNIYAEIRLPSIFSNNMVLQRDCSIPIWGWSAPSKNITIIFAGKRYTTKASQAGEWKIKLPKHKAGGPYELIVNNKSIKDIYIGDVYLCSGQSNMELTVKRVMDKYKDEILSYENNLIRYTKTKYSYQFVTPQDNSSNVWEICTKENALTFAALCYFFAKEMQAQEKVPIGIINSSWGGTTIASWSTRQSLEKYDSFKDKFKTALYTNPNYPDSIKNSEKRRTDEWYYQQSKEDLGNKEKWQQYGFDDSTWKTIDMFKSNWGGSWNHPINGVHYFRQRIQIPDSLAGKRAILRVGAMKDADITYINGTCIGRTHYQYPPRIYEVPSGILNAGENEITIRLLSCADRPSFVKGKNYQLEIDGKKIPISPIWKHKIGCIMERIPSNTSFQNEPTGLYNSMIHPLQDYAIRGIIWYQGESDTNKKASQLYENHLIDLANDWRKQWGKRYPFIIVQLAGFMQKSNQPTESGIAQVRDAQRRASLHLENAALATAIDLGESNDIHPLNKKDLAHRCVLQMNKLAFNKKNMVTEGPMPDRAIYSFKDKTVTLTFKKETGKLKSSAQLKSIAIASIDGKYYFTNAKTKGNKVIIQWNKKETPKSIRYAWDNNPELSIFNIDGLPAPGFQLTIE